MNRRLGNANHDLAYRSFASASSNLLALEAEHDWNNYTGTIPETPFDFIGPGTLPLLVLPCATNRGKGYDEDI